MICEECHFSNPPESLLCEKCGEKLYQAKIRVTCADGDDFTYFLFPQKYTIGRGVDNDIVVADPSVSRYHAEIAYAENFFYLKDHGSKNGSLINKRRVSVDILNNLDCIQLGNVVIHFYDERNQLPHSNSGLNTEEIIQKEYLKYTEKRQTIIRGNDVLQTMLDFAISLTHADLGVILLVDQHDKLSYKVGKDLRGEMLEKSDAHLDWPVIESCLHTRQAQIVNGKISPPQDEEQATADACVQKMVFPLLAAKLKESQNRALQSEPILGVFYFCQKREARPLSAKKRALLEKLLQQAAFAVEDEKLHDDALEKRRIDDELSVARDIQQRLLPGTNPKIKYFDFASIMQPWATVSGDYFDLIEISSDSVGIAIGDICGKGMPAALLFSTVLAAIRTQLEYTDSPKQIVRRLNQLLIKSTAESIFLTLFFGIYERATSKLKYVNAGHPPPILVKKHGSFKELKGTTPALGILEGQYQKEKQITVKSGDLLLMYTDGLIESQNREKKIYGRKRLHDLIEHLLVEKKQQLFNPASLIESIKDDLTEFVGGEKQTDDLTLLAVRRR
ncbi:MAG: SpoIIE family protein phosphatase [bacterium]